MPGFECEKVPSLQEIPQGAHPLNALTTLAIMYANATPVPAGTEILFATGNLKPGSFTRADIVPHDQPKMEKEYANLGLEAMVDAGLLEDTGERQRKMSLFRVTTELSQVTNSYNQLYMTLLSGEVGINRATIWSRSIGMLKVAYFEQGRPPEPTVELLKTVSMQEGVSPEHITQRALKGYAAISGCDGAVDKEIERQVVEHPYAKGGRRKRRVQEYITARKRE